MSYNKNDPKIRKKRLSVRARRGDANFEVYFKKTNNHFYAVVYNNKEAKELFCYSSLNCKGEKNNVQTAHKVGTQVANWCIEQKISSVYFNKLHYKFHGKLKAAVDGFNEKFNS